MVCKRILMESGKIWEVRALEVWKESGGKAQGRIILCQVASGGGLENELCKSKIESYNFVSECWVGSSWFTISGLVSGKLIEGSVGGFFQCIPAVGGWGHWRTHWEGFQCVPAEGGPRDGFQPWGARSHGSGDIRIEYVIVIKWCEFCSECENVKIVCIEYFLSAKEMSLKA